MGLRFFFHVSGLGMLNAHIFIGVSWYTVRYVL